MLAENRWVGSAYAKATIFEHLNEAIEVIVMLVRAYDGVETGDLVLYEVGDDVGACRIARASVDELCWPFGYVTRRASPLPTSMAVTLSVGFG
ncbi:MAG: hypothetical protein ACXV5A_08235 [Halobacteriota archaeon]